MDLVVCTESVWLVKARVGVDGVDGLMLLRSEVDDVVRIGEKGKRKGTR